MTTKYDLHVQAKREAEIFRTARCLFICLLLLAATRIVTDAMLSIARIKGAADMLRNRAPTEVLRIVPDTTAPAAGGSSKPRVNTFQQDKI